MSLRSASAMLEVLWHVKLCTERVHELLQFLWHGYFPLPSFAVSLSGFEFLCKISVTETVSYSYTVPGSLKRVEPLTDSDGY